MMLWAKSSLSRNNQAPACVAASSMNTPGQHGKLREMVGQVFFGQRDVFDGRQSTRPARTTGSCPATKNAWLVSQSTFALEKP